MSSSPLSIRGPARSAFSGETISSPHVDRDPVVRGTGENALTQRRPCHLCPPSRGCSNTKARLVLKDKVVTAADRVSRGDPEDRVGHDAEEQERQVQAGELVAGPCRLRIRIRQELRRQ